MRVNCSRRLNLSTVCWASRNKEDSKEIAVTPGAKSTTVVQSVVVDSNRTFGFANGAVIIRY